MPTCRKCNNNYKLRVTIDNKKLVLSNKRRYCLDCSPYMGHNSFKLENFNKSNRGTCKICDKPSKRKNCHICSSCETKIRRIRVKLAALKFLGGKRCSKCGYDQNIAALQFHHLDPNEKDFQISHIANRKWEIVKEELKKCIILCANCHISHHSSRDEALLQEIDRYNGRLLDL